MLTIILIILILMLIGALPTWGYSRGWGPYPSGGLGLIGSILASVVGAVIVIVVIRLIRRL